MKTKTKNAVRNLLELRADYHKSTFGESISWEIKNRGTKEDPDWTVDIIESQSTGASHHYEVIGMIAQAALVSHWLSSDQRDGEKVIKFHLY